MVNSNESLPEESWLPDLAEDFVYCLGRALYALEFQGWAVASFPFADAAAVWAAGERRFAALTGGKVTP